MVKIKHSKSNAESNARVGFLQPPMIIALMVANEVYAKLGVDCVITSGIEGKHKSGSCHPKGLAVDLRIRDFDSKQDAESVVAVIQDALGPDYQVILEGTHIHIEFDPQTGY